jgi:uncharacterized protein YigA (DUF484 family)
MIPSSESAPSLDPVQAAAEAVKAYIRMNRARLATDGELLALLLPERFNGAEVLDLQHFAIERLRAENQALKIERDGLKGSQLRSARLGDSVRRLMLDLVGAQSFAEVVAVATGAADALGADKAVLCLESASAAAGTEGVRLIGPGTVTAVLGPGGMGAILSGGGEILFGPEGAAYRSLAALRLRLGGLSALYVLGAVAEDRFEGREIEAELGYFARGLERAIGAKLIEKCLDPPKA